MAPMKPWAHTAVRRPAERSAAAQRRRRPAAPAWAALLLAAGLLSACVMPGGKATEPAQPNPITGAAIEVTALPDAAVAATPVAAQAVATDSLTPAGAVAQAAAGAAAGTGTGAGAAPSAARPDQPAAAPAAPPRAAAEAVPAAPPEPELIKSASQLACEKRMGRWSTTGNGSQACVEYTKDGGKQCSAASQCSSQCLARSGTCAPYKPLFGCNEIFDEMGRRMTLCLE